MTKLAHDSLIFYIKEHPPLKKRDSSFLLCMYTMLVILLLMVFFLLIFSVHYKTGPEKKEEFQLKKISYHDDDIEEKRSSETPTMIGNFEENHGKLIDFERIVNFLTGEEELTSTRTTTKNNEIFDNFNEEELFLKKSPKKLNNDTCLTKKCEETASKIMSLVDFSPDPCGNFYNFACGAFNYYKRKNEISFNQNSTNFTFTRKSEMFFESCSKHQTDFNYKRRIEQTKELLSKINGNITEIISTMILLNSMPFFDVDIEVYEGKFILTFIPREFSEFSGMKMKCLKEIRGKSSPGKLLNITILYENYGICKENYTDYLNFLRNSMEELWDFTEGEESVYLNYMKFYIETDILEKLPKFSYAKNDFVHMNMTELITEFPSFDWEYFVRNVGLNGDMITIRFYDKNYFRNIFELMSENYQFPKALKSMLTHKFYEEIIIPKNYDFCELERKKLMPDISNFLLKRNNGIRERKEYLVSIFETLKQHFFSYLIENSYLTEEDKLSVRKELNGMQLAFDDENNEKFLQEKYEKLELSDDDHIHNHYNLMKFHRESLYSLHGEEVTNQKMFEYLIDGDKIDPVYFYGHKTVYIPSGLTKRTSKDLPDYIVMAQVGFHLAKTFGHLFGPYFKHYHTKHLPKKTDFEGFEIVFDLNENLSRNERIADNIALELLTKHYESIEKSPLLTWISFKFSREKIFYLALVQDMCENLSIQNFMLRCFENSKLPPQLRVWSMLKDSDTFLTQFSCQ